MDLKWSILPHQSYSLDRPPKDFDLFVLDKVFCMKTNFIDSFFGFFVFLMAYQLFLGYLMPKPFS